MPQETDNGALVQEGSLAELAAVLAAATVYAGAKLHLYQASFSPTFAKKAADFLAAEATYNGYAPVALTYSAPGVDANGIPTALSSQAFFQATDGLVGNVIGGCWLQEDTVGPPATHTAIRYFPFAAPKNMTAALDFIGVTLGVRDPQDPGYAVVEF